MRTVDRLSGMILNSCPAMLIASRIHGPRVSDFLDDRYLPLRSSLVSETETGG